MRRIAERNWETEDDWNKILNPANGKQYSEDEAKNLQQGAIVCLPQNWS